MPAHTTDFHTQYKEIKRLKPAGIRGIARAAVLDALALVDRAKGIGKDLGKPRVQFIYIHHVFKDEEKPLAALLKTLDETHRFIPYSEGVERVLGGNIDRAYACISSDDGLKNNVRAAEILTEQGASGCFFINPAIINVGTREEVERFCRDRIHFPLVEFMDWRDVDRLMKLGHEIGSHTMGHSDVATMGQAEFEEDCGQCIEVITRRCGGVRHFAFPYGRFVNFNDTARQTVFKAGFISCASAERGCHIPHGRPLRNDELCLRRDHVVFDWKLGHILHFLAKNARNAGISGNLFPYAQCG